MTAVTPPRCVLVLRFSALGDVILTSPALQALKQAWPGTRVVFATKTAYTHGVERNPHVDRVVAWDPGQGMLPFLSALRAESPEAILDLHGRARSKMVRAAMLGTPTVAWEKRPWQDTLPVRLRLRPYHARMHIAARYHAAVETLVGQTLPRGTLRHTLSSQDVAAAVDALAAAGVVAGQPYVGMSPGANWETKRWPVERFGLLAQRVHAAGFQVVLTGTANEAHLAQRVQALVPTAANLCGKINVAALGGVIAGAKAFVANDSGPMHLARALGVPTLTFFGSTDPRQFEFDGHALMFAGVECSPCSFYGLRACPQGHLACMMNLNVDAAFDKLVGLLAAPGNVWVHA